MSKCNRCYFCGQCSAPNGCGYFSPVDDTEDDAAIAKLLERGRVEYYEAWIEYIEEDDFSF